MWRGLAFLMFLHFSFLIQTGDIFTKVCPGSRVDAIEQSKSIAEMRVYIPVSECDKGVR